MLHVSWINSLNDSNNPSDAMILPRRKFAQIDLDSQRGTELANFSSLKQNLLLKLNDEKHDVRPVKQHSSQKTVQSSQMWTKHFMPKKYTDLLSDEVILLL